MSDHEIVNEEMSRDRAAEFFARLVADSLEVGHTAFLEALSSGIPPRLFGSLSVWYRSLDETGRAQAAELVRQAMHAALFDIMCLFDGVSGIPRIGESDQRVSFALSADLYPDFDAYMEDAAISRTVINSPMQEEPHLHDRFQDFTEDRLGNG